VDALGRLHGQPCPSARCRRPQKGASTGDELEDPSRSQARQALGRSRSGLTTRGRLAADGRGLPLAVVVTPGNVNDSTVFDTLMSALRVPRAATGRPRTRPTRVLADKAYSTRAIRSGLRGRGSGPSSPSAPTRSPTGSGAAVPADGHPRSTPKATRPRNVVERCFCRLKQFRAVATRFDKSPTATSRDSASPHSLLWLRQP
jgi:transposase